MMENSDRRDYLSGFYDSEGQKGIFGFGGEVAPRILKHFLESTGETGPQEELRVVFWPADKSAPFVQFELAVGGYSSGNVDLLSYRPEIRALLTDMIAYCEPD